MLFACDPYAQTIAPQIVAFSSSKDNINKSLDLWSLVFGFHDSELDKYMGKLARMLRLSHFLLAPTAKKKTFLVFRYSLTIDTIRPAWANAYFLLL